MDLAYFDTAFFDPSLFDEKKGLQFIYAVLGGFFDRGFGPGFTVSTDLVADVIDGMNLSYGISGNGPLDCVAGSGQCQFTLRNDEVNGTLGRYSPGNSSRMANWTFGIPFRFIIVYGGVYYARFTGKIRSILPDTGIHSRRQVVVTAYDVMRDLAETDVSAVPIQIGQTEAQIVTNVLASLPSYSQPLAVDIDPGIDTLPYALDTIGSTAKALSVIGDVARSSFALVACKGDGTLILRNRHTRMTGVNRYTFNGDFMDIQIPSDLSNVYNLVRVTIHPKTIDTAPSIIFSMSGSILISAGQTLPSLWGSYNDPFNAQRLIGGTEVEALIPSLDYLGNASPDGDGLDLTDGLSIVATPFATTVKFDITNTSSVAVYLTMLQIRGKGIYDLGPQVYQATSDQSYGIRSIDIDMPYQGNPYIAQAAAEFVQAQYCNFLQQVQELSFIADTDARMLFALTVEPGDRITVSEPVTGVAIIDVGVQLVSLSVVEKIVTCKLGLAPITVAVAWKLGVDSLGVSDILGF